MAKTDVKNKIQYLKLSEIKPYEKNPRINDKAVYPVAESIKNFGFQNPIITDKNKVIIAGHTRYKAAEQLGLDTVPVIIADLPEEKARAYRIADNRSGEFAEWDFDILKDELSIIKSDLKEFLKFDFEVIEKVNNTDEWVGMPEFETIEHPHGIHIKFKTEEAREDFLKKFDIKIAKRIGKTWSTWWPYREKEDLISLEVEDYEA